MNSEFDDQVGDRGDRTIGQPIEIEMSTCDQVDERREEIVKGERMSVMGPTADRLLPEHSTRKRTFGYSAPMSGIGPKLLEVITTTRVLSSG